MSWQTCFRPEIRSRGLQYFLERRVHLLSRHGLEIRATIKGTKIYNVVLSTSPLIIQAQCDCPHSLKGMLCKHIFATLCAYFQEHPQNTSFLKIVKTSARNERASNNSDSNYKHSSQSSQKGKAEGFSWSWFNSKENKKESSRPKSYPSKFEDSFIFFEQHGYPLKTPLTVDVLRSTKNRLMKKIHPDVGGKTEDATQLNRHFELLVRNIALLM